MVSRSRAVNDDLPALPAASASVLAAGGARAVLRTLDCALRTAPYARTTPARWLVSPVLPALRLLFALRTRMHDGSCYARRFVPLACTACVLFTQRVGSRCRRWLHLRLARIARVA